MIPKDIDQITEADLQELIENSVAERKTIEYKRELPGNKDSDKKEFLADVSSFANASGGDIVYGVAERNSIPTGLVGIDPSNIDEEIRRLESLIRDGIRPRIFAQLSEPIKLKNGKVALVIRITKSWQSPHRVIYKGHDKFYGRDTKGKYPLDVDELRIEFNLSETIREKIEKFRVDRIGKILADDMPICLQPNPKVAVHVMPLVSFSGIRHYEIKKFCEDPLRIRMLNGNVSDSRYNFEGVVIHRALVEKGAFGYVQLFNNGIIEAVDASLIRSKSIVIRYERELIEAVKNYLCVLKELSVELPVFIALTLIGVKGCRMAVPRGALWTLDDEKPPIDRDVLVVPEGIIEKYDVNMEHMLRLCFESVWNACGFARSLNYNENGNWIKREE